MSKTKRIRHIAVDKMKINNKYKISKNRITKGGKK